MQRELAAKLVDVIVDGERLEACHAVYDSGRLAGGQVRRSGQVG
jgi:hypothetical protein